MVRLKIQGFEQLNRKLKEVNQAVDAAGARSIRKVAVSTRAEWARGVVKEINLPVSSIKEAIRIHSSKRASIVIEVDSRNVASLGVGRRLRSTPVIKFKPRQTKKGVSVRIKKSKGRKLIKSAFIVTMPTGHEGVFYRVGKKRLPIKEAKTTAVEEVAMDIAPEIQRFASDKLQIVFTAQLNYELGKRGLK